MLEQSKQRPPVIYIFLLFTMYGWITRLLCLKEREEKKGNFISLSSHTFMPNFENEHSLVNSVFHFCILLCFDTYIVVTVSHKPSWAGRVPAGDNEYEDCKHMECCTNQHAPQVICRTQCNARARRVLLKFRGSEHYVFPTASTKLFNIKNF